MGLVLRKIKKAKWYKHKAIPWLKEGELQADALADLKTTDNNLSFWIVEDDKSNLDRIITALAAKCQYVTNIDFVLLEQSVFDKLKIRYKKSIGDSHDLEINTKWHIDIIELTASKLYELAKEIQENGEKKRYNEKKVTKLIIESINTGKISKTNLQEKVLTKIDQLNK